MVASADKRRILYLDTAPSVGGSVISLYGLLAHLDRSRYEPYVVCSVEHEYVARFRELGVEVFVEDGRSVAADHRPAWAADVRRSSLGEIARRLPVARSLYHGLGFALYVAGVLWPRARALRERLHRLRVDLVHTNVRIGHDREGILGAFLAGTPCVCHLRDFERLNLFDRWLASRAQRYIYISDAVRRDHELAGMPPERGRVVYNAVESAVWAKGLTTKEARQSLGLNPGRPVVGVVGRLESWKGQDVFIRSLAEVRKEVPSVLGLVVGDGVAHEPDYRQQLAQLREDMGLWDHLEFWPFQADVARVMLALDVLVLPSRLPEPFGRVLIEAMAAGRPVVATDAGATPEIVRDGVHGLLVPPNDPRALGASVSYLLKHRQEAASMGERGRKRAQDQFNMAKHVEGIESVYGEMLRGSQASARSESCNAARPPANGGQG